MKPPYLGNWNATAFVGLLFVGFALDQTGVRSLHAAEPPKPRPAVIKPARTQVDRTVHDAARIYVKFHDDLPVRLRNGRLTHGDAARMQPAIALLARLERDGGRWQREHRLTEEKLDELRATAQQNTGRAMPDLNTAYLLEVPRGFDIATLIDEFNALEAVELAQPMPLPTPPPVVPNFEPNQVYLNVAADGIDARYAWTQPGGTGTDVRIADIEYLWNLNHADLNATLVGPQPVTPMTTPPADGNHGTAVVGMMGSLNNGVGVTGMSYGSTFLVVAANTTNGYNPGAAITTAAGALRAGDVMVLELQADGPAAGSGDWVPVEWVQGAYNAIVTAVGNGIIVVEAAGNGGQDLDAAIFNTGHRPFLPGNDSGAIIVGAGVPPGDTNGNLSRLTFSSYGSTVDLQGWGEQVTTTGYGDLHSSDGTNNLYTATFSGTSSATPMVASACAALQGAHKWQFGTVLSPREVGDYLRGTGTPQRNGTNPATQNIGPRPNLRAAMAVALRLRTWVDFAYSGVEVGTFLQPFNSVPEGISAVPFGGTVTFKGGQTPWTGTITKSLTLDSFAGPTTLGQ